MQITKQGTLWRGETQGQPKPVSSAPIVATTTPAAKVEIVIDYGPTDIVA